MILEQRRVSFGRSLIAYQVERSERRETVTIGVDPNIGVLVKAPSHATLRRLDDVVKSKASWILQRLMDARTMGPRPAPKEFVAGESFSYLGRCYRLKIARSPDTSKPFASLQGAFLSVALPRANTAHQAEALVRRAVVAWYRKQADRRLPERVELYASRAGLQPPPVFVREQEKRWGSCSSKGELRFNWRVMMAPMPLVDYVVAHEVCHLLAHDHSKRFWALLRTVLPDYEERRERLRIVGTECFI